MAEKFLNANLHWLRARQRLPSIMFAAADQLFVAATFRLRETCEHRRQHAGAARGWCGHDHAHRRDDLLYGQRSGKHIAESGAGQRARWSTVQLGRVTTHEAGRRLVSRTLVLGDSSLKSAALPLPLRERVTGPAPSAVTSE